MKMTIWQSVIFALILTFLGLKITPVQISLNDNTGQVINVNTLFELNLLSLQFPLKRQEVKKQDPED